MIPILTRCRRVGLMGWIEELERAASDAAEPAPDAAARALASLSWMTAAIDADRAAGLFTRWGRSTVIDESIDAEVIPRPLFQALHERAGLDARWPIGNAGLLHTYGYLLSSVHTPHGRKRERWLGTELSTALGLGETAFLPWQGSETLLRRATEAASVLIASGGEFSWYSLADGRATRAVLGQERGGLRALAYAVATEPGGSPKLVTMFPTAQTDAMRRELDETPSRLRWNAA